MDEGRARFNGSAPMEMAVPSPRSIHDFLRQWDHDWPLSQCKFPHDMTALIASLRSGMAVGVTDGSWRRYVSDKLGAAAFRLECSVSGSFCSGICQTSGSIGEVNPYRSEIQGIHGLLLMTLSICQFGGITSGKVRIGCDNLNGVRHASFTQPNVPSRVKHQDLIRAIRRVVKALPITVEFFHIDRHQDDFTPFELLSRPSQLNVLMDEEAKAHILVLDRDGHHDDCPAAIQFEGWSCWVGGVKQVSDPSAAISRQIHRIPMMEKLHTKGRLDRQYFDRVDWDAVGDAMESFPPMFRVWASKHMSHFCGVARYMKRCGFWSQDRGCPCCDEPDETTLHLLVCPHYGMNQTWQISLQGLSTWLVSVDTHPDIYSCIMNALRQRSPAASFFGYSNDTTLHAALAQDHIGWQNFVEGKIALEWKEIQREYYRTQISRRTARSWAKGLVRRLLELVHSQWTYRNSILHERDSEGMKKMAGLELRQAINEQFDMGTQGLDPVDRHYIRCGIDSVLQLPVPERKQWLLGIRLACEVYTENESTGIPAQRRMMENYFGISRDGA